MGGGEYDPELTFFDVLEGVKKDRGTSFYGARWENLLKARFDYTLPESEGTLVSAFPWKEELQDVFKSLEEQTLHLSLSLSDQWGH